MEDSHPLQVRDPNPFGPIVGVADVVAPDGTFAAYLADPGHPFSLLRSLLINLFGDDVKENVPGSNQSQIVQDGHLTTEGYLR
jgi:hypothetical protein